MELTRIQEIINGDINKFTYFVEEYQQMAYSIAYRILSNAEDTEEVVQDAFLKAYKSLSKFKGDSKFSTWFYKIVVNTALSKLNTKHITSDVSDVEELADELVETMEATYKGYSITDQRKLINRALDEMVTEDRLLLTLYYLNESTIAEVSEITNIASQNIKMKLLRARKKMFVILNALMDNTQKISI